MVGQCGAVGSKALLASTLERHLEQVLAVGGARGQLDAGHRLAVPHHLPLVAGSERASRQAEVKPLEQVGLAGAVRAVEDGHARAELDLEARVVAKVPQADADRLDHTFSLIGITR
jgi:hypothetical protein